MGKVLKSVGRAVGSIFGVTQASDQAKALGEAANSQATAIQEQAAAQAKFAQEQLAAQQRQLEEQRIAANQATQAGIDNRNLSAQMQAQLSKIKDQAQSAEMDAPVKVDLSIPTAADAGDVRKKYQTGAAVGGKSGGVPGVGIRV